MKKILKFLPVIPAAAILGFGILTGVRGVQFSKINQAEPLSLEKENETALTLKNKYPEKYQILKKLPYTLAEPKLSLGAESAILIDMASGEILYEKNADEIIPPASMTKLFTMYVVEKEIAAGRFTYDQIIQLPPESYACNMPPHSSLMFLGEGQKVTLEELLLGLSICSGNDAAYALAYTVSGSMQAFIDQMNQVAQNLGLENTHFVESSGYSELNQTTPREMAEFCKVYLTELPDSIRKFHSVASFTYPKERNLAPGDTLQAQDFTQGYPLHITMPITQDNTNPLLGKLEGCDGLKTGYIDESGYNLALTAQRNGTRFLSVTMKGPGKNSQEGQEGRAKDGTTLMEYAFGSFADYKNPSLEAEYFIKLYGAKEKALKLIPAYKSSTICVPFITGNSIRENLQAVSTELSIPECLYGATKAGEQYGSLSVKIGNTVIEEIPLVADRSVEEASFLVKLSDKIIMH